MNKNDAIKNTQPVTTPIASGLQNRKRKFEIKNWNSFRTEFPQNIHILGFSVLLKSRPNKFAPMNISPNDGINRFVMRNAPADIAKFVKIE